MTQTITNETLQSFIRDELLNGREVAAEDDLLLSGLIDSLGVMALVKFIEDRRGAAIPAEDVTLENFATVGTITAYLHNG